MLFNPQDYNDRNGVNTVKVLVGVLFLESRGYWSGC